MHSTRLNCNKYNFYVERKPLGVAFPRLLAKFREEASSVDAEDISEGEKNDGLRDSVRLSENRSASRQTHIENNVCNHEAKVAPMMVIEDVKT